MSTSFSLYYYFNKHRHTSKVGDPSVSDGDDPESEENDPPSVQVCNSVYVIYVGVLTFSSAH